MKKVIFGLVAVAALALAGCSTTQYETYAQAQATSAKAESDADTARIIALSRIAESGDAAAKSSAIMALAMSGANKAKTAIAAPVNEALQWAQVLSPLAGQGLQGMFSYRLGVVQSNNAVRTEGIRYNTMSNVAGAGIEAAGKVEQVKPCIITEAVIQCD
jgi:hypothetical protein